MVVDPLFDLAAGSAAGATAVLVTYPLDLVRTRLAAQTQGSYYRGIGGTLARIVADEGPTGLSRGLGATLLQVGRPAVWGGACVSAWLALHLRCSESVSTRGGYTVLLVC